MMGSRLRALRAERKINQEELGKKIGVGKTTISQYESETRKPDSETLVQLANIFDVSVDYLLGRSNQREQPYYALNDKDEKDIAKRLESLMGSLESDDALAFHGGEMDDDTRELLKMALEHGMRIATETAKKKYTPNKYRK
jgi:transcriptional regulator with XRE-family HTH domain